MSNKLLTYGFAAEQSVSLLRIKEINIHENN